MKDIPVMMFEDKFVLMNKPGSPILRADTIMRGEPFYNVYEGDVIEADGDIWLVCYERGFYAINENYVIRFLYKFNDIKFIDRHDNVTGLPTVTFKKKFLFKIKDQVFVLNDIVGAYSGDCIFRTYSEPVKVETIQQDCGLRYNGNLMFLGDTVDGSTVELYGGRVVIHKDGQKLDLSSGGFL